MTSLLLIALLATPQVSRTGVHHTTTCENGSCTRVIQNDINFDDEIGTRRPSEDSSSEAGGYSSPLFPGKTFTYRKRSRITFLGGDEVSITNKTTVGAFVTAKPGLWFAVKFVDAANTNTVKHDNRTLKWLNVLPNTDLYWRATRRGLRGRLAFDASPGVGYMELQYAMPAGATVVAAGDGWNVSGGGAEYHIGAGLVWDSENGDVFNIDPEGTPITSVTTIESDTTGANRVLVIRVDPNNGEVTTALGLGRTVFVRLP